MLLKTRKKPIFTLSKVDAMNIRLRVLDKHNKRRRSVRKAVRIFRARKANRY